MTDDFALIPYQEGMDAADDNTPRERNPYAPACWAHDSWDRGWFCRRYQIVQRQKHERLYRRLLWSYALFVSGCVAYMLYALHSK